MTVSVAEAFHNAQAEGRAAIIAYLPAGFPDRSSSIRLIRAMIDAGVDMVEVGVPYSDPVMDGPVICQAAEIALAGGATTADAIEVVRACSDTSAALLTMSYWNLIEAYGPERFTRDLAAAGGAGTITPDLTPEEGQHWIADSESNQLAHVFLAAPSSGDSRLQLVADSSAGFVYAASLMGVVGVRASVGETAQELVSRLREITETPIAVGLGVSTAAQASEVAAFADGVIVGSAFVKRILEADDIEAAENSVAELARELVAASHRQ